MIGTSIAVFDALISSDHCIPSSLVSDLRRGALRIHRTVGGWRYDFWVSAARPIRTTVALRLHGTRRVGAGTPLEAMVLRVSSFLQMCRSNCCIRCRCALATAALDSTESGTSHGRLHLEQRPAIATPLAIRNGISSRSDGIGVYEQTRASSSCDARGLFISNEACCATSCAPRAEIAIANRRKMTLAVSV
jgi:hypothetical protein